METAEYLKELVGEELSAVTFVRDYLQLQFDPPPMLNIYTVAAIEFKGEHTSFGESGFANALIEQIGKTVTSVSFQADRALTIVFDNDARFIVSLRSQDYTSTEAINLYLKDGALIVI